ncbi:MAG: hypothetical protein LBH13_09860 [Cellulomonadaceae bacterium]|jgi:prephenate dehydratase/chorismate mutase/prephenate dehydratase|nr:hypothetical protein [Cellulomonadaceae bacterium]
MSTAAYLGPEGTFAHQAALAWSERQETPPRLEPIDSIGAVVDAVRTGQARWGIVPLSNSTAGPVPATAEALAQVPEIQVLEEIVVPITMMAFVRPHHGVVPGESTLSVSTLPETTLTEITAHPHALAQSSRFVTSLGLTHVPASSNAVACRDLQPHQVALGTALSGELYGLDTFAENVGDDSHATTRFGVIAVTPTSTP